MWNFLCVKIFCSYLIDIDIAARFGHEMKPWWAPRGKKWLIPNLIMNTGLNWEVKWVMKGKGGRLPLTKPRPTPTIEYLQDRNGWSSGPRLRFYWQFIIKCGGFCDLLSYTQLEDGPILPLGGNPDHIFDWTYPTILHNSLQSCIWHPNRSRSTLPPVNDGHKTGPEVYFAIKGAGY